MGSPPGLAAVFSISGGHCADEHGFGCARGAMPAKIACNLASPSGVTDVNRFAKIESFDERKKIIGGEIGSGHSNDDGANRAPSSTRHVCAAASATARTSASWCTGLDRWN